MKTKKLLARLTKFLDADKRAQLAEAESIHKVLKKLKEKERKLRKELAEEPGRDDHEEIAAKLEVIYTQRKKGVAILRELRGKQASAKQL